MKTVSPPQEVREIHTRLLRLGMAVEESRAYWRKYQPGQARKEATEQAFEERWFGAKSYKRVEYLIFSLGTRFEGFVDKLKAWDPEEKQDRCWVCHFHLQFTDPLYRLFSDGYLSRRLERSQPSVENLSALEWLEELAPGRWAAATAERLVSGLSSCLTEAGFCRGRKSPRAISIPPISDTSLAYLLYFLKDAEFEGRLLTNPYIGGTRLGPDLNLRLKKLPGIEFQSRGDVSTIGWKHETFQDWLAAL